MPQTTAAFTTINLLKWIDEHPEAFTPPVMNKQFFHESQDAIIFVSKGPNTRNDYHVNPTEELFYQLKGDIAVRVRPLDGSPPHNVIVREGELFLLPRWVPHRPQRPKDTIGLIVEFPRGVDANGQPQKDGLRWYCPSCDALVYEAQFLLEHIDRDLHRIMNDFWDGPADRRTCTSCGTVISRAPEFEMDPLGGG
ncbi:MAG: 3-hydroxyanthranilate 3,4-dioxygenase [Phycisphaerales bacterium]|nr:MAG: 3-hydroxyanthranilate 3,4-dioxygenase [Phycisphaerales bacterium]